ncbi:MAG: hypothetical protein R2865_01725 [Deinococcales bacterium]
MIKASRRQHDQESDLNIHLKLAKGYYWQHRLFICSLSMLALSFVLLIAVLLLGPENIPRSLGLSLATLGLGFFLGFLWPIKHSETKALDYIDQDIGLSYRTLVELRQVQDADLRGYVDDFGLSRALEQRAKDRSLRLSKPDLQAWWLLICFAAILLAFLPYILPLKGTTSLVRLPTLNQNGTGSNTAMSEEPKVKIAKLPKRSQKNPTIPVLMKLIKKFKILLGSQMWQRVITIA